MGLIGHTYILLTYSHFSAVFLLVWVLLKNDLMKRGRHSRVEHNEMRKAATQADIYSAANSIAPNYLVALQSSLLPANTGFGNTRNCRAAARRYLKDKMSNPPHSNFSAMSLNASKSVEEETSEPSLFSETCEKAVPACPIMVTTNNQVTLFVHLEK